MFGYSAIVSERIINLNAKCKQICICYTLKKQDFYEILSDCPEDMQYFHELKNKIDLAKIPEEVEAPFIINIREHYHPIATYILAKNRSELNKLENKRKFYCRTERR